MEPLIDPPVPYLGQIQGAFVPGLMVRIQGFASPVADRFDINFQTSGNTAPRDDIGLHLSVRLAEGYVARNSVQGGTWGEEQNNGDLPIQPGQKYEIIILSDAGSYKIAINGNHFCEFPQRIPASRITHLSIEGDTSLSLLSFENLNASKQEAQAPNQQANQNFGPPPSIAPGQYGPPGGGYGGPPQAYGPQPGYGPPPGQYGPPQYGPSGYGPPPPPPGSEENASGLDNFLESAGPVIAGVISSGVAEKLLTSITGGGNPQQSQTTGQQQQAQPSSNSNQFPPQQPPIQHQQQQQQQQQQGAGGSDVLTGIGSLITNFVAPQKNDQQTPYAPQPPPQYSQQPYNKAPGAQTTTGGSDVLGGIGSLLSTFSTPQNPQQQQRPQPPPQPVPQQQGTPDYLGTIGSLISNYAASQNQQKSANQPQPQPRYDPPPQPRYDPPSQTATQTPTPDYLGTIGSLLSNYAASQNQPKGNVQQPPQATSQQSNVDVVGGITSLLSNLNTGTRPNQQQPSPSPQIPTVPPQSAAGIYPQLPNTTNSQNSQQQPQQQYQQPQQPADAGPLGGLGSLLSSFAAPAPPPPQSAFAPSNIGGQGSVGNLGSVGSLLSSFAGQILQPQNKGGQPQ